MKLLVFCLISLLVCTKSLAQSEKDSVTISGYVYDYDNRPLSNVSVEWKRKDFSAVKEVLTDANGYYTARIKKGRYYAMSALNRDKYVIPGSTLPEEEMRLEFWAWNFIACKDTVLNIRYDRIWRCLLIVRRTS